MIDFNLILIQKVFYNHFQLNLNKEFNWSSLDSMLVLLPDWVKERMGHGLFNSDSFLWVQREKAVQQVVQIIVVTLSKLISQKVHVCDLAESMFLDVFGEFEFIPEIFALFNDFVSKEVCQLNDIVDIVTVLYVVGFVDHSHVVENVVFSGHELQQYHSNWPNVRLVRLVGVMQNWF